MKQRAQFDKQLTLKLKMEQEWAAKEEEAR